MSELFRRLRYLLNRRRFDQELASEMEAHRELAARDGGKPFGNALRLREEARDAWGWTWIDRLLQDLRYTSRVLRKSPGFTFVVILSLTLGIGANTAIFQILNAVRLRNLPVSNPRQLAELKIVGGNGTMGLHDKYGELTRPIWEEIRRDHPAFSDVFAWSAQLVLVGEGSASQLANGIVVSDDFFHALGITAWRGRVLRSGDEHACPESAAMVSYPYWQTTLGGREIGAHTKLLINGKLKEIVGVTPPSFFGLATSTGFGCNAFMVPGVDPYANGSVAHFLNAAAFSNPPAVTAVGQSDYAPLGGAPTQVTGPAFHRLDLSLFKRFYFTERIYSEFRAEVFNLTNTPNFSNPSALNFTNLTNFRQITSTRDSPNDPREIQFGLKLYW